MSRLAAITRCCAELEQARSYYGTKDWGLMIWELDQLTELHRLLYEVTA